MAENRSTRKAAELPWRGVIALAPVVPAPEILQTIQEILELYDLQSNFWFHISLRLLAEDRQLVRAARYLPEIAAHQSPFGLRVSGAAFFSSNDVVYLKVAPEEILKNLRRQIFLRQGWPEALIWLRNLTWIPHLSVAYQVGERGWEVARQLSDRLSGQEIGVDTITLRNRSNQDWLYKLGTGEAGRPPSAA